MNWNADALTISSSPNFTTTTIADGLVVDPTNLLSTTHISIAETRCAQNVPKSRRKVHRDLKRNSVQIRFVVQHEEHQHHIIANVMGLWSRDNRGNKHSIHTQNHANQTHSQTCQYVLQTSWLNGYEYIGSDRCWKSPNESLCKPRSTQSIITTWRWTSGVFTDALLYRRRFLFPINSDGNSRWQVNIAVKSVYSIHSVTPELRFPWMASSVVKIMQ